MKFAKIAFLLMCFFVNPVLAHDVVLMDEDGDALVVLSLLPEWSAVAARDALELTSPNDRTRIHCVELRSSATVEEGKVFLKTMRETLFQTYQENPEQPTEIDGVPAILYSGRGISRGFDTYLEALVFREPGGRVCLVMLQQDVGYESKVTDLKTMVRLP